MEMEKVFDYIKIINGSFVDFQDLSDALNSIIKNVKLIMRHKYPINEKNKFTSDSCDFMYEHKNSYYKGEFHKIFNDKIFKIRVDALNECFLSNTSITFFQNLCDHPIVDKPIELSKREIKILLPFYKDIVDFFKLDNPYINLSVFPISGEIETIIRERIFDGIDFSLIIRLKPSNINCDSEFKKGVFYKTL